MFTIAIMPQNYLQYTQNAKANLALAQCVDEPGYTAYTTFFRNFKGYKILDNGVAEGYDAPGVFDLVKKANFINADEIVLPDVYKDCYRTMVRAGKAKKEFDSMCRKENPKLKLMGVLQGTSMEEVHDCCLEFNQLGIDVFGIPKHMIDTLGERDARLHIIYELAQSGLLEGKEIHLLGCWKTPLEVITVAKAAYCNQIPMVRSCDSAIPFVYARNHKRFSDDDRPDQRPIHFDNEHLSVMGEEILKVNLEHWYGIPEAAEKGISKIY